MTLKMLELTSDIVICLKKERLTYDQAHAKHPNSLFNTYCPKCNRMLFFTGNGYYCLNEHTFHMGEKIDYVVG